MPLSENTDAIPELTPIDRQQMDKYGVRQVVTAYFVYRSYRYTNLADALAQAKLESTMAD